ncbi:hypothetical protein BA896_020395 [Janthinobacterium lividum]|uniref:Uncharacterized protein n=1 Tax=Janthinobacterium lividum TaxID=29581 RepID=A0A1E8PLB9_9BURK|nr:hypothetical protein BA896_020395 [Janthinobacterium lividum]
MQLLIAQRGIAGIYTPNPVVWSYLNDVLKKLRPAIPLINASPVHDEMSGYRSAMAHARKTLATPLPIASAVDTKPALPELQLATLFRHANVIPGMCDDEKSAPSTKLPATACAATWSRLAAHGASQRLC